ncbi:MAG: hypothetical protein EOP01_02075 [Propionibacteriaceae bacterium]|nr:MAG: hypothetical protein EOP01_02075 [Propionibacteriaceae bacterium]
MILVQPDGRLAVWSSVVDSIVVVDATDEEVVAYFADEAARRSRESTVRAIERVRTGQVPRMHLTWEEAVTATVLRYGDEPFARERFGGTSGGYRYRCSCGQQWRPSPGGGNGPDLVNDLDRHREEGHEVVYVGPGA